MRDSFSETRGCKETKIEAETCCLEALLQIVKINFSEGGEMFEIKV